MKDNIKILSMQYRKNDKGVLRCHNEKNWNKIVRKVINILVCIDNGSILFSTRDYTKKGSRIACNVMTKWGLTVHVGTEKKKLKSKVIYFLLTIKKI